jgi:hypothetical protein
MNADSVNEGVSVTGSGQVKVKGSMAVGRNAQAISTIRETGSVLEERGQEELREKLDALLAALEQHADELEDPDDAFGATQLVADELRKDKPSKLTIKGVLAGLAGAAGSAGAVAQAALTLAQAVHVLL